MSRTINRLEQQVRDFINIYFQKDAEVAEKTAVYLQSANYEKLGSFMEKIDKNYRRSAGVLQFEILGLVYQLQGESFVNSDFDKIAIYYEQALAAYEKGMHFATGSGEGWHFRDLYDSAERRLKRLQKQHGR